MMMRPRLLTSDFLPGFLQLDLGVRTSQEHPLVKALDHFSFEVLYESSVRAHSMDPSTFDITKRRETIERCGFKVDMLSESTISLFFDRLAYLLGHRSTLEAVDKLAQLYFSDFTSHRGRPHPKTRMTEGRLEHLSLVDADDVKGLVFLQLKQHASAEVIAEFSENARLLIPVEFRVEVAAPRGPQPEKKEKLSADGFTLSPRRL